MLAQQSQHIRPRRILKGAHIVIRELSHQPGNIVQRILARLRTPESMCEQVLRSLVRATVSEKTFDHKVNHLDTMSAIQNPGLRRISPSSQSYLGLGRGRPRVRADKDRPRLGLGEGPIIALAFGVDFRRWLLQHTD